MRVEALNQTVTNGLVDVAQADAVGRFVMAFDSDHLNQLFPNEETPVLYFRVFDGNRLLADTRDTVTWRPNGQSHVRIVVDAANPPPGTADPAPSVVKGFVADSVEGPLAGVTVLLTDRVVQRGRLTDTQVGTGTTDASGRYRIEYMPTDGKVKADLTVRALDRTGAELVQSEMWCQAPPSATVDLTVGAETWPGPAEHDEITGRLDDVDVADLSDETADFLACSRRLPAKELGRLRMSAKLSRDYQVSQEVLYALGSQGLPVSLRSLLAAEPAEIREAAGRAIDANAVSRKLAGSLDIHLTALRGAAVAHVLQPTTEPGTASLGDLFATGTTDATVHMAFLERFVARTGTVEEFWTELVDRPPFDKAGFVEDLQFSLQLGLLTQRNLPLLRRLGTLRNSHGGPQSLADLTAIDREGWRTLLVEATPDDGELPIPPDIAGDTPEARTERYLDSIVEPLKEAFPGRYLRQSIRKAPEVDVVLVRELHHANANLDPREPLPAEPHWGNIADADRERARASWGRLRAEALAFPEFEAAAVVDPAGPVAIVNPIRHGVDKLLTNLADPDLRAANLDTIIAEKGDAAYAGISAEHRTAVVNQAKRYQRVYRIAPRAEHVEAMLGAGFHSALGVARTSSRYFARQFGGGIGDETAALRIHGTAMHLAGSVQAAITATKQAYFELLPWAIGGNGAPGNGGGGALQPIKGGPDWESLFGQLVFCECGHCRSVFSPTAYLVDLLQFLGPKARGSLLARRADLAHIPLTCENTNTTIPYIDLVNEILESRVANGPTGDLPAYDTEGATAEELRAMPQHVLHGAYDTLAQAVYPMTLPFHRPLAVTRSYLGHLGVAREELLALFRSGVDAWDATRVAESLGMSPHEYQVITSTVPNPPPLHEYYGNALEPATWKDEIAKAPVFLRQTGLVFTDLVDVVKTWFVNRNQSVPALRIALDAPGECDIEGTTITHLADDGDVALDRIHRFLRLWRRVGWTIADLDRALFALEAGELDAVALRKVAQLRRLMSDLDLPLAEALALWAPIDTWGDHAHYLKLFRSRAVARLEDSEAFALTYPFTNDPADPAAAPDPEIKHPTLPFELTVTTNPLGGDPHTAVVLAALRITETDLDLIRGHAGIAPDAPIDLALLSTLYRYTVLARRLRLRIADLVSLLHLTGLTPFELGDPAGTLAFAAAVDRVKQAGMKIEVLDYLYRHAVRPTRGPVPAEEKVTATLTAITDGLHALQEQLDSLAGADDPTGENLRAILGLAFPPEVVAPTLAIVLGEATGMPADPPAFLAQHIADFADTQEAVAALLHPLPLTDQQRLDNIAWMRQRLLPWLRRILARGVVVTALADALGLRPPLVRSLIETHLQARVTASGYAIDDFLALASMPPAQGHRDGYELLHKAALLVDGLDLTDQQVVHLLAHPDRFAGFTFDGLPLTLADPIAAAAQFASWQRVADLTALQAELPEGARTLVDLFDTAVPQGEQAVPYLLGTLAEVTGWDPTQLAGLAASLAVTEPDLRSEAQLLVLRDCLAVARRVGVAVEVLFDWAVTEPDVDRAKAVVQTVKARYEHERWLEVARRLNDGLREPQRSALVDFLVPRMHDLGVNDANQLLEYFLVDPGMQSCMLTSRIRLALSSVQLFVQRCLLNLEPGVDPSDIDGDRWAENSLYRVWEANRKVCLYPENWILPELLVGKSPFLRQLETELLQNELTDENVEQAYLNYLRRLDEVAHLDVQAMHWEQEYQGWLIKYLDVDRLHVVARTSTRPYRYFYRRFENHREWTPWEPVDLDIGDAPHVLLTVHNRRLQLLWTSFKEKPLPDEIAAKQDPSPPLRRRWEIQLAWSERRQGMWSPPQLSLPLRWPYDPKGEISLPHPSSFSLHVDHSDDLLVVNVARHVGDGGSYTDEVRVVGEFYRDGATADFDRVPYPEGWAAEWLVGVPKNASLSGMHLTVNQQLYLRGLPGGWVFPRRILDELPSTVALMRSNRTVDLESLAYYPFFLADGHRCYFAYPVPATPDPQWSWPTVATGVAVLGPGLHIGVEGLMTVPLPWPAPGDPIIDDLELLPVAVAGKSVKQAPASPELVGRTTYGEKLQLDQVNPSVDLFKQQQQDLRFMPFWHPHVSNLVRALNRDGIPGLLTLENQELSDPADSLISQSSFTSTYKPTGRVARPRPRENFDFEPDGAYSLYNWELFFHTPMLIANRLRQDGRYAEARRWLHYVFDPTTDVDPTDEADDTRRFWRFKPFHDNDEYARVQEMLELLAYTGNDSDLLDRKKKVEAQVQDWLDHPFEPHRIARLRLVAYQKYVLMSYIDLLLEWADQLYRRFTIESINEATQLYVLAANLLGPRPMNVPARSTVAPKTYAQLEADALDDLSNAAVALESVLFPFTASNGAVPVDGTEGGSILGMGQTLYFCAPENEKLLAYWEHVEDRLFKIRHCQDIEGVTRQLALFDPPIDPAALVRAAASGADLDSVLGDLFAPLPPYRFSYLLTKASELCAEVKALGTQLHQAYQSRDAEHMAYLRTTQERALLSAVRTVKQQQIEEAESAHAALGKSLDVVKKRHDFYDTIIKISAKEREQLDRLAAAQTRQDLANRLEVAVTLMAQLPSVTVGSSGSFGSPVATANFGRDNAVAAAQSASRVLTWMAGHESYKANLASINAGHERRAADWDLQRDLAALEITQIEEQMVAADLRKQIAEKELANHELQMAHAAETEEILRRKFTNEELYGWMVSQVSALYFQAYKLAYDVAKRAERAYRFERGLTTSNFVIFGYWDGLRKGLLAGERLSLDLKRLEAAYLGQNSRNYELSLRVALSQWDPQALVQLKTTGTCEVDLTEQLYDANCQCFFRRIRSLSATVACVTGPYTNINCTVTMLGNRIRTNSQATNADDYPEQPGDARFLYDFAANSRIATSHGNDDTGLHELTFRDERYLPFEGAGAVCRLRIDMPQASNGWDLSTTSDVVLTVRYDAREGGDQFRAAALAALDKSLGIEPGEDGAPSPPLRRLLSARHELSEAWHRFLHPADGAASQELVAELTREHYPYLLRSRSLEIVSVDLYLWPRDDAGSVALAEDLPLTLTLPDDTTVALTLTPAAPGDPIPLAHAGTPDGFTTDQTTGTWRLTNTGPALTPASANDLVIVLTYHVTDA